MESSRPEEPGQVNESMVRLAQTDARREMPKVLYGIIFRAVLFLNTIPLSLAHFSVILIT